MKLGEVARSIFDGSSISVVKVLFHKKNVHSGLFLAYVYAHENKNVNTCTHVFVWREEYYNWNGKTSDK